MFKHSSTADTTENAEMSCSITDDKKSFDSADTHEFVIVNKLSEVGSVSQDNKPSLTSEPISPKLEKAKTSDQCPSTENSLRSSRYEEFYVISKITFFTKMLCIINMLIVVKPQKKKSVV